MIGLLAHNHPVNRNTRYSPFQVVYGVVPRGPLDLLTIPSKVRLHATTVEFIDQLSKCTNRLIHI